MGAPVKHGFALMPGLPSWDDPELAGLMDVVTHLPREGADEIARSLLRAALA
jgi:hypothetical protein